MIIINIAIERMGGSNFFDLKFNKFLHLYLVKIIQVSATTRIYNSKTAATSIKWATIDFSMNVISYVRFYSAFPPH